MIDHTPSPEAVREILARRGTGAHSREVVEQQRKAIEADLRVANPIERARWEAEARERLESDEFRTFCLFSFIKSDIEPSSIKVVDKMLALLIDSIFEKGDNNWNPYRKGEGHLFAKGEEPGKEWWCSACSTYNWNEVIHCRACRTENPKLKVTEGDQNRES